MRRLITSPGGVILAGNTACWLVGPRPSRYRVDDADRDSESATDQQRIATRLPGIRDHAPRRNALVTLAYLASFAFLAGLFGRLLGLVP